jgi:hypothetical protein
MNLYASFVLRDLACGAAAVLITLLLSVTFVQSTSVPPGAHASGHVFLALQPKHAWFGQPEPAVLVD